MSQLFLGNFETGDTSQFTSASGSAQNTVKFAGSYAGENNDNENFRKVLNASYSTIFASGMYRWSVDPAAASNWFVMLLDSDNNTQFVIRINAGKLTYEVAGNATTYTGLRSLSKDTWYHIEVKLVMHNSAGSFEVRINGGVDGLITGIDTITGADTGIKSVKWQGVNGAGSCYVDNLSINDVTWDYKRVTLRVTLPGYNCLTDTNPDHFALIAEEDWVLIKEFSRGTTTVTYNTTTEINHNLNYIPFVSVWYQDELDNNQWNLVSGIGKNNVSMQITSTKLKLINRSNWAVNVTYRYYIFYDYFA